MKIRDMMIVPNKEMSIRESLIDKYNKEKFLRENIIELEETLEKLHANKINIQLETQKIIDSANEELKIIQEKIAKAKNQLEGI